MPVSDLILLGFELMLLGMGIVFTFLIILVFALKLMSRIAAHFEHIPDPQQQQPFLTTAAIAEKPANTALIAVISAAVTRYRSSHN